MREPAVTLGAAVPRVKPRRRKEVRDPYDGLRPWSAITHGIGAGLAVISTLLLVGRSLWEGNWFHAVVFLIYGLSMICLYTASTLYHCVNTSVAKRIALRKYDHCSIYLLIAGLAVAARYGFEHKESLEIARKTYVDVNIHDSKNAERVKDLDSLPYSCEASAERLYDDRAIFEAKGVFAPALIDGMIAKLKSYDQTEAEAAKNDPAKMLELVRRYFYCG